MEAIVLAGGLGTRLREVVSDVPKSMAPVDGKPFLEILLHSLSLKGFTRVILSLGYMSNTISNYFGANYCGMQLAYAIEDSPLGTGGAIRLAMTRCHEDHCFILNGDTYLDLEVNAVEQLWQQNQRPIVVGRLVSDTSRYGRLLIDHDLVTGFSEKGVSGPGPINAGCYVFGQKLLDFYQVGSVFSIETDFLSHQVKRAPVDCFLTRGHFIDIGIPEDYARAQIELANLVTSP